VEGWGTVRVLGIRLLAVTLLAVGVPFAVPPVAGAQVGAESGRWILAGWTTVAEDSIDQGLSTVASSTGTRLVTRSDESIPPSLAATGWQHVGDPDSYNGFVLDAYQRSAGARTKLYTLTTPSGARYRYVHPLTPGEMYKNSFTAIAPGGHWFVSGEWGTMRRLLVFAMPSLPPTGARVHRLPLATVITLDRPVRNVQGCAFSSATTLQCSTNDKSDDLFGVAQQLLTVHLARSLDGRPVSASVSLLGAVPGVTACQGATEVEGIDVHAGQLRVSVVSSCTHTTTIYDYRLEPGVAP
jgi:hypothetical protein